MAGSCLGAPGSRQCEKGNPLCCIRPVRLGHSRGDHKVAFNVRCQRTDQYPKNNLHFTSCRHDLELISTQKDPRKPPPPRLLDILVDSRLCRSTYPVDKVYGVLWLVSVSDTSNITINYGVKAGSLYKKIALTETSRIRLEILRIIYT